MRLCASIEYTMKLLNQFKKILIVEDDPALRKALMEKFSSAGYRTCECADGAEVAFKVSEEKPDGIVLDLMLPNKDGMAILETLRGPEVGVETPVVILTNLMGKTTLRKDAEKLNALYFDKSSTDLGEVVTIMERIL